uniref:NADH dehydrogenase [ubiquinone] 1 alpha subcomplex subunit 12 n=1 Tax=Ditylenchus dipsaci TaxID=166011 RepID=A0A915DBG0_9BILA
MSHSWKQILGIDKLVKLASNIKKIGGVRAVVKQRFLMDTNRAGDLVGVDKFGNKYYEDNTYFMPRNRYVVYSNRAWLDYDGSQVVPEWHRWLHHICDKPPTEEPLTHAKWMLDHKENLTLEPTQKYVPYSTTRPKIQGWEPGNKKGSEV